MMNQAAPQPQQQQQQTGQQQQQPQQQQVQQQQQQPNSSNGGGVYTMGPATTNMSDPAATAAALQMSYQQLMGFSNQLFQQQQQSQMNPYLSNMPQQQQQSAEGQQQQQQQQFQQMMNAQQQMQTMAAVLQQQQPGFEALAMMSQQQQQQPTPQQQQQQQQHHSFASSAHTNLTLPSAMSLASSSGGETTAAAAEELQNGFLHNTHNNTADATTTNNTNNNSAPATVISLSSSSNNSTHVPMGTMTIPAAMALAPPAGGGGARPTSMTANNNNSTGVASTAFMSSADRAKQNRDRNREHARSTRQRKKAYVQKLRELVEGLHAERNEAARQRRVAVQQLAQRSAVRCNVLQTFLQYHANNSSSAASDDPATNANNRERQWSTILEDDFWCKQPVTPFRSFRRAEIEKDYRISRGVQAMICDSASVSVMLESIGHCNPRWMQIKREEFVALEANHRNCTRPVPSCITRQESRLTASTSALTGTTSRNDSAMNKPINPTPASDLAIPSDGINNSKLVILSQLPTEGTLIGPQQGNHSEGRATVCGQSDEDKSMDRKDLDNANKSSHHHHHHPQHDASKDFHDYNAKPLPDPKYGSSGSSSLSAEDDSPDNDSTGDDGTGIENPPAAKRRKTEKEDDGGATDQPNVATVQPTAMVEANSAGTADMTAVSDLKPIMNSQPVDVATTSASVTAALPPNVAKKGGISHNVRPVSMGNGAARLQVVPIVKLPPFTGLGKKRVAVPNPVTSAPTEEEPLKQGPVVNATALPITTSVTIFSQPIASATTTDSFSDNPVTASLPISQPQLQEPATAIVTDNETASSSNEECNLVTQIHGHYHVNEDDRVLMEDVLMCPFMFRSRDAIHCGSVSECVMPGMLRAQFSARNKLQSVELLYDAMGLMQQLARASGQEGTAQIVPGSVEMALTPTTTEARVITMAEPPYLIMNVNEVWTRTTGYTQMDVEGKEYLSLLEGEETVVEAKLRPGKPWHLLEEVAKGRPACSTNIHCRKDGQGFVEFVCSYPLTNESDEITHILHVSKELPSSLSTSNHR